MGKPLVHAVADGAVVVERGEHLRILCNSTSSMPTTLRKVSCWPAKDASGKSSAVAEERTAKTHRACRHTAWRIRANLRSKSAGKAGHQPLADFGARQGQGFDIFGVQRGHSAGRFCRPSLRGARNCRKAWAVVAKPVGTRTPEAASWLKSFRRGWRFYRQRPRHRSFSGFQTVRPRRSP
jgi:hypothetical protein